MIELPDLLYTPFNQLTECEYFTPDLEQVFIKTYPVRLESGKFLVNAFNLETARFQYFTDDFKTFQLVRKRALYEVIPRNRKPKILKQYADHETIVQKFLNNQGY